MALLSMRRILYFFFIFGYTLISLACTRNMPIKDRVPDSLFSTQDSIKVSLAELYHDPATYNHKQIKISGVISHGFEDFTLSDPNCPSRCVVWLEYGGKLNSGTIYCCGISATRKRKETLVVENISIPLLQDETFRKFDTLIQRQSDVIVKATIVGQFFAGEKTEAGSETRWGGFGHFGCCSLLAIEQVISID